MTDAYRVCHGLHYSRGSSSLLAADHPFTYQTLWLLHTDVSSMAPSALSSHTDNYSRTGRAAANSARQAIKRQVSSSPEPDSPPRRSRRAPKTAVKSAQPLSRVPSGSTSSDDIEFMDQVAPPTMSVPSAGAKITEGERQRILAAIRGELAWVRVNGKGELSENDEIESYWWPAEVSAILRVSIPVARAD